MRKGRIKVILLVLVVGIFLFSGLNLVEAYGAVPEAVIIAGPAVFDSTSQPFPESYWDEIKRKLLEMGYKVEVLVLPTKEQIQEAFSSPETSAVVVFAHGSPDSFIGGFTDSSKPSSNYTVTANDVASWIAQRGSKIPFSFLLYCNSLTNTGQGTVNSAFTTSVGITTTGIHGLDEWTSTFWDYLSQGMTVGEAFETMNHLYPNEWAMTGNRDFIVLSPSEITGDELFIQVAEAQEDSVKTLSDYTAPNPQRDQSVEQFMSTPEGERRAYYDSLSDPSLLDTANLNNVSSAEYDAIFTTVWDNEHVVANRDPQLSELIERVKNGEQTFSAEEMSLLGSVNAHSVTLEEYGIVFQLLHGGLTTGGTTSGPFGAKVTKEDPNTKQFNFDFKEDPDTVQPYFDFKEDPNTVQPYFDFKEDSSIEQFDFDFKEPASTEQPYFDFKEGSNTEQPNFDGPFGAADIQAGATEYKYGDYDTAFRIAWGGEEGQKDSADYSSGDSVKSARATARACYRGIQYHLEHRDNQAFSSRYDKAFAFAWGEPTGQNLVDYISGYRSKDPELQAGASRATGRACYQAVQYYLQLKEEDIFCDSPGTPPGYDKAFSIGWGEPTGQDLANYTTKNQPGIATANSCQRRLDYYQKTGDESVFVDPPGTPAGYDKRFVIAWAGHGDELGLVQTGQPIEKLTAACNAITRIINAGLGTEADIKELAQYEKSIASLGGNTPTTAVSSTQSGPFGAKAADIQAGANRDPQLSELIKRVKNGEQSFSAKELELLGSVNTNIVSLEDYSKVYELIHGKAKENQSANIPMVGEMATTSSASRGSWGSSK